MATLENLTTLTNLKKNGVSLIENKLFNLLNNFNEMLASCEDEYDYFSLIVSIDIFNKFAEDQFKKDLLEMSTQDAEEYVRLKNETATKLYKDFLKEVSS